MGKEQPPAMAPPKPGLVWNPVSHRWVNKSSTTAITSWKPAPSEKIKVNKVTWGDPKKSLDKLHDLVKDLPAKPGKDVEYRRRESTEEHSRDVGRALARQKPVGMTGTPGTVSDLDYRSRTEMLPRRINPGDVERLPKRLLKPVTGYQYEQKSVTESDMVGLIAFLDYLKTVDK